jgi:hypothetical protein
VARRLEQSKELFLNILRKMVATIQKSLGIGLYRWIHSLAFAFPPISPDGSVEAPTFDRRISAKSHDRRSGEKSAIAKKYSSQPPQQISQYS